MRIADVVAESRFQRGEDGIWRYRYRAPDGFMRQIKAVVGICEECGQEYVLLRQSANKFCSHSCAGRKGSGAYRGKGDEGRHWKGGRIMRRGYVLRFAPNHPSIAGRETKRKYVLEHRLIMEEVLGRPLRDYETVHHRNGDRQNNARENLVLRIGAHGQGASMAHCQTCTCFEGVPLDVLD